MVSLVCGYVSFMDSFQVVVAPKYVEGEVPIPFLLIQQGYILSLLLLISGVQIQSFGEFLVICQCVRRCYLPCSVYGYSLSYVCRCVSAFWCPMSITYIVSRFQFPYGIPLGSLTQFAYYTSLRMFSVAQWVKSFVIRPSSQFRGGVSLGCVKWSVGVCDLRFGKTVVRQILGRCSFMCVVILTWLQGVSVLCYWRIIQFPLSGIIPLHLDTVSTLHKCLVVIR